MGRGSSRERFDVVVIGGGQAGLAVGHYLARAGVESVILDSSARVGDSWRHRFDGLRLFTRARYDALPGMRFPAPGGHLPSKDAVADYLESYAKRQDLPVRSGVRVERLSRPRPDGPFLAVAAESEFEADAVVIATGAYAHPNVPAFADQLDTGIHQLHSSDYRRAAQLVDGPVLVVGASNSGAEIALDAAASHPAMLVGRDTGKMPVRPESRLGSLIDRPFWFFINHVATLDNPIGRKALPFVRGHGGPLERIWPADLEAAGVERIYGRIVGAEHGRPRLDDGRTFDVANVVWSTGFRPEFGWIELPATGPDGWPRHRRGVSTVVSGLYFVGLPFLHSAGSPLLGGVGRDAAFVVSRISPRRRSLAIPFPLRGRAAG